jgi:hypothetical protein
MFIVRFSDKGPIPCSAPLKVFRLDPAQGFVRVPSSGPPPQTREDFVIHATKGAFTHDVPMIIDSATYLGVEFPYQIGGS